MLDVLICPILEEGQTENENPKISILKIYNEKFLNLKYFGLKFI